jgi:hypothetical protein
MIIAITLPHLLYLLLVWLPETTHKSDLKSEDRTYIEFEQMAYTHFDLLAQDKTNFGLNPALQDSLMECFKTAARPTYLIKFSNDELMWGKASALIAKYYNNNYDSMERYYIALNTKLLTKYPIGLTAEISKQVLAFYVPNYVIHKDLFNCVDFAFSFNENTRIMNRIEPVVIDYANMPSPPGWKPSCDLGTLEKGYRIVPGYPSTFSHAQVHNINRLPLIFTQRFWFYRFFSPLFLAVMLIFFAIRMYKRKLLQLHIISLIYLLIFIYVLTVAIVHTFDCTRFVITIYPFLLAGTCMATVYVTDFILNKAITK